MKVAWLDMWWFTLKGFVTDLVFEDATSLPVQPASVLPPSSQEGILEDS